MFNTTIVQKALKHTWASGTKKRWSPDNTTNGESSLTSQLIYDIFGGEILKTHQANGWHFYNRIDGECLDFATSEMEKSAEDKYMENLPSAPNETYNYFEQEEYSTFFNRFIRAFEEAVGLKKFSPGMTV